MRPRVRSSVLWGLVGALSFLVLTQGYQLLVAPLRIGALELLGIAVGVGVLVAGVTYAVEHRVGQNGST